MKLQRRLELMRPQSERWFTVCPLTWSNLSHEARWGRVCLNTALIPRCRALPEWDVMMHNLPLVKKNASGSASLHQVCSTRQRLYLQCERLNTASSLPHHPPLVSCTGERVFTHQRWFWQCVASRRNTAFYFFTQRLTKGNQAGDESQRSTGSRKRVNTEEWKTGRGRQDETGILTPTEIRTIGVFTQIHVMLQFFRIKACRASSDGRETRQAFRQTERIPHWPQEGSAGQARGLHQHL